MSSNSWSWPSPCKETPCLLADIRHLPDPVPGKRWDYSVSVGQPAPDISESRIQRAAFCVWLPLFGARFSRFIPWCWLTQTSSLFLTETCSNVWTQHILLGIFTNNTFFPLMLWILWAILQRTFVYKFLHKRMRSFSLGVCLPVEFPDPRVPLTRSLLSGHWDSNSLCWGWHWGSKWGQYSARATKVC